eukprot:SAG22_NODE_2_length_61565_cov_858.782010_62_plen_80_part_00
MFVRSLIEEQSSSKPNHIFFVFLELKAQSFFIQWEKNCFFKLSAKEQTRNFDGTEGRASARQTVPIVLVFIAFPYQENA